MIDNTVFIKFLNIINPSLPYYDSSTKKMKRIIEYGAETERLLKPYMTFKALYTTPSGVPYSKNGSSANENGKVEQETYTPKHEHIQIVIYNETLTQYEKSNGSRNGYLSPKDLVNEMVNYLTVQKSLDFQKNNGFAVHDYNVMLDIDEILSDKRESRASCELILNYVEKVTTEIDYFEFTPDNINLTLNVT